MEITQMLLDKTAKGRPGTKLSKVTAVACHYIGNPNTTAIKNRNYFNTSSNAVSSHYIIGLQGEIIQCLPEDEISYCTNSANSYTISIEACHPDSTGRFNNATYNAYVWLCADICKRYGLDPVNGGLIRHYDVTGKVCPKWFVDNPSAWETFKQDVKSAMEPVKNGWIKNADNKWLYRLNGNPIRGDWYKDNGDWYYFGDDGCMVTGWLKYKEQWYYLRNDGKMHTGWLELNGVWYFLNEDGDMHTGWFIYKGRKYYMDSSGAMAIGRTNINEKWYDFNPGQIGVDTDYGALVITDSNGARLIYKE